MFCPNCGKEIKDDAKFCPFCGCEIKKSDHETINGVVVDDNVHPYVNDGSSNAKENTTTSSDKYNTSAIIGFILSFIFPIGGIILCVLALVQIYNTNQKGRGLATAGLIIGMITSFIFFCL